ncbi:MULTISPECIES: hydrogen peroxide-inducible genes activator [unclassified Roseobacter]|uniref:hydrogen peroxide-inducible genes activator n=1 Tax=unclassified Roseobacter TaxID=196798 RepID=UPI0018A268FA|nr:MULTISPECIES: hydrogen peroxide-inducible genes activator [unclassified Roseobacter]MDW3183429.1 hydrogen peroxide-inducible genes activator [Roseobacter sp.]
MENFTIKQLRYFEAVALHGHFGRAAEASSISQPAISVQIKELEETLGQLLFERHARHIRLTSFGEEFAQRVRPILRSIDDLSDLARASHDGLVGKLRLGIIPTIGPYLLPRLVADLNGAYPRLDLRIRETQTENLIFDLLGGQLDVALVALPISEPGLTEVPLFDESFVLVRSLSDAEKPVPSGETLSRMRLLLLEEGHCFRDQALAFCGTPSNLPRESMEGSSLSTLVQMVASGLGVTLIPEMAVALETRSADVSVAHFKRPEPTRTIGMVWRKSTPLADQLTDLAGRVKQTVVS